MSNTITRQRPTLPIKHVTTLENIKNHKTNLQIQTDEYKHHKWTSRDKQESTWRNRTIIIYEDKKDQFTIKTDENSSKLIKRRQKRELRTGKSAKSTKLENTVTRSINENIYEVMTKKCHKHGN